MFCREISTLKIARRAADRRLTGPISLKAALRSADKQDVSNQFSSHKLHLPATGLKTGLLGLGTAAGPSTAAGQIHLTPKEEMKVHFAAAMSQAVQ